MEAKLIGDGKVYQNRFYYHMWWNRVENALYAAWAAHQGYIGRSCIYDCGPHASCRCGVCVSGGDDKSCLLPHCDECTPFTFQWIVIVFVVFILLIGQLIYALLRVMHAMNRNTQDRMTGLLGFQCCLCDPRLYSTLSITKRRPIMHRMLYCRRIPAMLLVILTVLGLFFVMEAALLIFADLFNDINSVLPEELFPSDHLMLVVQITKDSAR